MRAQVRPRFLAEPLEIRARAGAAAQRNLLDLTQLVGEIGVGEVGDSSGDLFGALQVEPLPRRGLAVMLDEAPVRPDQEVVDVHPGDLLAECRHKVVAQPSLADSAVAGARRVGEREDQFDALAEEPCPQRRPDRAVPFAASGLR